MPLSLQTRYVALGNGKKSLQDRHRILATIHTCDKASTPIVSCYTLDRDSLRSNSNRHEEGGTRERRWIGAEIEKDSSRKEKKFRKAEAKKTETHHQFTIYYTTRVSRPSRRASQGGSQTHDSKGKKGNNLAHGQRATGTTWVARRNAKSIFGSRSRGGCHRAGRGPGGKGGRWAPGPGAAAAGRSDWRRHWRRDHRVLS